MARHPIAAAAMAATLTVACPSHGDDPFFIGLSSEFRAWAVSADGTTVVGAAANTSGNEQAAFWTAPTGIVRLGYPAGAASSRASAVSADGSVIIGNVFDGNAADGGWTWTAAAGFTSLNFGGWTDVVVTGISGDGVAVGFGSEQGDRCHPQYAIYDTDYRAFRQNQLGSATLHGLGTQNEDSAAYGISLDGSAVVGSSWIRGCAGLGGPEQATVWRDSGATLLGYLSGDSWSRAIAASADGAVVVGSSSTISGGWPQLPGRAFRWTQATGMQAVDGLDGSVLCEVRSVSGDGSVMVGDCWFVVAPGMISSRACIWDAAHGPRDVRSVLVGLGLDLTGWDLLSASGVSADGRTIVGHGVHPSEFVEGWIAHLGDAPPPCPGDVNGDQAVNLGDLATLLAHFGTLGGATYADGDLDADSDVDLSDLATFLANFGEMCPP